MTIASPTLSTVCVKCAMIAMVRVLLALRACALRHNSHARSPTTDHSNHCIYL